MTGAIDVLRLWIYSDTWHIIKPNQVLRKGSKLVGPMDMTPIGLGVIQPNGKSFTLPDTTIEFTVVDGKIPRQRLEKRAMNFCWMLWALSSPRAEVAEARY